MSVIYGQKWTSQITDAGTKDLMKKVWSKHLAGYDPELIGRAIDQCVHKYPGWPPTLGEFTNLCGEIYIYETSAYEYDARGERIY